MASSSPLAERRQRPRQLVHELADTGPLAQRGTVVEQNPHRVAGVPQTTTSPCGSVC